MFSKSISYFSIKVNPSSYFSRLPEEEEEEEEERRKAKERPADFFDFILQPVGWIDDDDRKGRKMKAAN